MAASSEVLRRVVVLGGLPIVVLVGGGLAGLPQGRRAAEVLGDPVGEAAVDGQHVGGQEGGEPQRRVGGPRTGHGRWSAGGWVSSMRTATTRPEAAVRPA